MAAFAQAPQKMSYQAVIRNASNALIDNQSVGMQISVLQGSSTGTPVYVETQTPTTNANGLANLEIGTGTIVSGTFASIDWSTGTYYIKTETDPTGGTSYTITGASQLLSVPYALYAGGSNGGLADGTAAGNTPFWNGTNWVTNNSNIFNNGANVGINTNTPERLLEVHSNITYSAGQTPTLMLSDNFQKWNLGLGYSPAFRFSIASEDSTERFVIQQTGNVGIGTINPLAKLDVAGQIKITDGTHGAGKVLTSDANGLATWTTPGSGSSNLANGTAVGNTTYWNGTDWVETSNLFSNGTNVGIGTTAPTSQFDIMGNTESRSRYRYGTETAGLTIGNWSGEAYVYNELNTDLVFGTNSATRIRIKNDGNVGIGTDTPGAKLDVAGTIKITDGSQAAGKVLTSDANGLATWATPTPAAPSAPYHEFTGTTFGQTMNFPVGTSEAIMTVALKHNCASNNTAAGMIYYDINSNSITVLNSSPNAIAYIEATGNVLTSYHGCTPNTYTFTATGGVVTITVGGNAGTIINSKWTVLGM